MDFQIPCFPCAVATLKTGHSGFENPEEMLSEVQNRGISGPLQTFKKYNTITRHTISDKKCWNEMIATNTKIER